MNSADKIHSKLPSTFTRQDVLNIASEMKYSYSTANSTLDKLLYKGLAERIDTGKYKKIN